MRRVQQSMEIDGGERFDAREEFAVGAEVADKLPEPSIQLGGQIFESGWQLTQTDLEGVSS